VIDAEIGLIEAEGWGTPRRGSAVMRDVA